MRHRGPGRVFLSYRRQDTAWPARQIYEVLAAELGAARVFKDVDDIAPGEDFVQRITGAVAGCDVLLALIGPAWTSVTDESGARRLDDPEDFVRLEVGTALGRPDVRVIPILVDSARMPQPAELPADLASLPRRHAVEINPVSFDTRRLVETVRQNLARPPGQREQEQRGHERPRSRTPLLAVLGAVTAVAVLTAAVLVGLRWDRGEGPDAVLASVAPSPPSSASAPSAPPSPSSPEPSPESTPDPSDPDGSGPTGPAVLAHRGGQEVYPLETDESLTDAAEAGFAVETDVRWTKDRKAVVVHDDAATLGVSCDRPLTVSQTTWADLRKHCRSKSRRGRSYPIATYDQVLDSLSGSKPWLYVEVKVDQDAAQDRELLGRIHEHGLAEHTVVTSTEPARLDALRARDAGLRYFQFVSRQVPAADLTRHHLWGVGVRHDVASRAYVASLKKAGLVVVVWTVNEPGAWKAARAAGADKLLTDEPRACRTWLAAQ